MNNIPLLVDFVIILAVVIPIVLICQKLKIPTIIGFIVAGIIIGPHSLAWIKDHETVDMLAEIGIILLLFTIGIEFSLTKLSQLKWFLLIAGGGQVLFTVLVTLLVSWFYDIAMPKAILFGFMIALSSTAIVLKILGQRKEIDSPAGRLTLSILLFQDLCIVPIMLFIPILQDSENFHLLVVAKTLMISLGGIAIILVGAKLLIPRLLNIVVKTNNRELFLLTVIFLTFGTAWISSLLGLSLALGAFLSGLIISESEYSHQILADVFPMRDSLTALFFISIGMLLNVTFFAEVLPLILLATFIIIVIKILATAGLIHLMNYPARLGFSVGMITAQVGEFSFVIAISGLTAGILTTNDYQAFLGASILTMMVSPFLISNANSMGYWLQKKLNIKQMRTGPLRVLSSLISQDKLEDNTTNKKLSGHVVIVGFGKTGQHLAFVLKETGLPFVINEIQHRRFLQAKQSGYRVVFGDSTSTEILENLCISKASMLVVATSDKHSAAKLVQLSRGLNPHLFIISRTRYIDDMDHLYLLGANQVIPEEFETSIEIFSRVLRHYHIPRNVISSQISIIRKEKYGSMRGLDIGKQTLDQLPFLLAATATESIIIIENSPVIGKTILESGIQSKAGVNIIAVVRNREVIQNPKDDFVLDVGDVVIIIGNHAEIDAALGLTGSEIIS